MAAMKAAVTLLLCCASIVLSPVQYAVAAGLSRGLPAEIHIHDVPVVTRALGLKLNDAAAERAFFAKNYKKVTEEDFRALQSRAEQAKRKEQKLIAAGASDHAIICNKIVKVGTEAVLGAISHDPPFEKEHLLKFRKNVAFAGKTCKNAQA